MSKYKSRKITNDGITFDSKKEYKRFCELSLLEKAGTIPDLSLVADYLNVARKAAPAADHAAPEQLNISDIFTEISSNDIPF